MHLSMILPAAFATLPILVASHGDGFPVPKIFGRSTIAELKNRNVFGPQQLEPRATRTQAHDKLESRQSTTTCGPGVATCAAGLCCSLEGYCGTGPDYCSAPDCQFVYGPACDANTVPPGASTSGIARPHLGSIPYGGSGVYDCLVAGTVALTFDDGPYIYTNDILDILAQYNAKATFMVTGNNNGKGEIDNAANGWDTIIKRAHADGHQITSHTWSHQNLDQITSAQRKTQMYYNEIALRNILGFFPTYMRPPYSACSQDTGCWADMEALGYHITYFDVDTDDYDQDSPLLIQNSKNWFNGNVTGSPADNEYLVIGHDIHEQTAHNLTAYMLKNLQAKGYTAVTLGECLGDPSTNWYRTSTGSEFTSSGASSPTSTSSTSTAPAVSATVVSSDGNCGGQTGERCLGSTFGNCCSQYGFCGTTSDYCSAGCQPAFGNCGTNAGSSSSLVSRGVSTSSTKLSSSTKVSSSTKAASSTATAKTLSTDGSCGGAVTCQGSTFGNCCSQYGYCGSTTDYCGAGCQSGFGTCT